MKDSGDPPHAIDDLQDTQRLGQTAHLLAGHILRQASEAAERSHVRICPEALERLVSYDWPGNVRELENVLRRALLSSRGDEIRVMDLPPQLRAVAAPSSAVSAATGLTPTPPLPTLPLRELEQMAILQAIERNGGNIEAAARQLGIGRATIYRRLARDTRATRLSVTPEPKPE